tara:strand:- start:60 stop:332 length:273 start_codon:yes stop_codon:yes gene_type:complete
MKCSICTNDIDVQSNGWEEGHNALPLSNGRCCTICNDTEVVPMRMAFISLGRSIPKEGLKEIIDTQRKARAIANVSLKNITREVNQRGSK